MSLVLVLFLQCYSSLTVCTSLRSTNLSLKFQAHCFRSVVIILIKNLTCIYYFLKSYSLIFLKLWCIFVTHAILKFNFFESFVDSLRHCPESHSVWWPMISFAFSWRTVPWCNFLVSVSNLLLGGYWDSTLILQPFVQCLRWIKCITKIAWIKDCNSCGFH